MKKFKPRYARKLANLFESRVIGWDVHQWRNVTGFSKARISQIATKANTGISVDTVQKVSDAINSQFSHQLLQPLSRDLWESNNPFTDALLFGKDHKPFIASNVELVLTGTELKLFNDAIDAVKARHGIKTDKELSEALGFQKSYIHQARKFKIENYNSILYKLHKKYQVNVWFVLNKELNIFNERPVSRRIERIEKTVLEILNKVK